MKLWFFCLLSSLATFALADDARPASVRYSYQERYSKEVVRVADECYVPIAAATAWGWDVNLNDGEADINAENRHVRVHTKVLGAKVKLPLVAIAHQLGAFTNWSDDGKTLLVLGLLRDVHSSKTAVTIDSTLPSRAKFFHLGDPERLVIDMDGLKMPDNLTAALPSGARLAQYDDDTVRLVIERPGAGSFNPKMPPPGRSHKFDFSLFPLVEDAVPAKPIQSPDTPEISVPDSNSPSSPGPPPDPSKPEPQSPQNLFLGRIIEEQKDPSSCVLVFPMSGPMPSTPVAFYDGPTTLYIKLTGVQEPSSPIELSNRFVKSISAQRDGGTDLLLTISLTRATGFELSSGKSNVVLRLVWPNTRDGKLAGKKIVVDAGHGGHDSGAKSGGVLEKNLTLKIARLLARELSSSGAAVIMTRTDDVFIPLKERSEIANRNNADIFISVHINSNKVAGSRSGNMTFYHARDPIGMLLAECIQNEIRQVSGLPTMGIWSDQRIWPSGFSVLRNAKMPAILLELGFINHPKDRGKMVTAAFQSNVSKAAVKGLKVFLGNVEARSYEKGQTTESTE